MTNSLASPNSDRLTKVLLSIRPEFAEKIFDGQKIFEFRKSVFINNSVSHVILYATMPTGKIVGHFKIGGFLSSGPEDLWEQTKFGAGISRDYFMSYFHGRPVAHAIRVLSPKRYRSPIALPSECLRHPPQSFRYVRASFSRGVCKFFCSG